MRIHTITLLGIDKPIFPSWMTRSPILPINPPTQIIFITLIICFIISSRSDMIFDNQHSFFQCLLITKKLLHLASMPSRLPLKAFQDTSIFMQDSFSFSYWPPQFFCIIAMSAQIVFFFFNIETLNFVKIIKKSSNNNEKSDDAPKS